MAMKPWVNGKVTFAFHNDGTISLRAQNATDKPEALFDPSVQSELAAIFSEIKAIGRSPRANSLWLRGDKKGDDGYFIGIPAKLSTTYTAKTGEEKTVPFAYEVEQLVAFTPQVFTLKARWDGHKEVPVLHAYATQSERQTRNTYVRPASEPVVVKAKESAKNSSQPTYRRANT